MQDAGINWGRVARIILGLPVVAAAAIGIVAILGDAQLQALGNELSMIVTHYAERIAYGSVTAGAVVVGALVTRARVNRWWYRNGGHIADAALQEDNRQLKRERNSLDYRLRQRTKELAVAHERIRNAQVAIGNAGGALSQVGRALAVLPDETEPEPEKFSVMRRVN